MRGLKLSTLNEMQEDMVSTWCLLEASSWSPWALIWMGRHLPGGSTMDLPSDSVADVNMLSLTGFVSVTAGRAGTFNNVVDGAGCKLLVMDHHRTVATGWPGTQLLKFHWDNSLACVLSKDVSQTSTHQCGRLKKCLSVDG